MILALPLRTIDIPEQTPWNNMFYLCDHYKKVFDTPVQL